VFNFNLRAVTRSGARSLVDQARGAGQLKAPHGWAMGPPT